MIRGELSREIYSVQLWVPHPSKGIYMWGELKQCPSLDEAVAFARRTRKSDRLRTVGRLMRIVREETTAEVVLDV
jgi:hypothetical protein